MPVIQRETSVAAGASVNMAAASAFEFARQRSVVSLGITAAANGTFANITSGADVIAGLVGIGIAWAIYSEQRIEIPAAPSLQRLLEHKFYFDELYDAVFYRPGVAVANGLRREIEEPVILQTGPDLGEATMETGGVVRRIQTGLLRTYVLFLAGGAAAVVLAFLIAK